MFEHLFLVETFIKNIIQMSKRKQQIDALKSEWMLAEISISYKVKASNLPTVTRAEDIYDFLKEIWNKELINVQEQFVAVFLNNTNKIIGYRVISTGTMKMCLVDIKLLASLALHTMCTAVILAHNHPSGNLVASRQDEAMTLKVKDTLQLIDVKLIDHLIITEINYYSFGKEGYKESNFS
jgi:DNA repair protein RadC